MENTIIMRNLIESINESTLVEYMKNVKNVPKKFLDNLKNPFTHDSEINNVEINSGEELQRIISSDKVSFVYAEDPEYLRYYFGAGNRSDYPYNYMIGNGPLKSFTRKWLSNQGKDIIPYPVTITVVFSSQREKNPYTPMNSDENSSVSRERLAIMSHIAKNGKPPESIIFNKQKYTWDGSCYRNEHGKSVRLEINPSGVRFIY